MLASHATTDGTARFAARYPALGEARFFRTAQGLTVSSIGLGSYLGNLDEATDYSYTDAAAAALGGGINFIDTSLNYRHQRSERAIGAALQRLVASGELARDEVVVCTKAGYLVPGAIPTGKLSAEEIASGAHTIAPAFLADQLARSRDNLGLETIDVFYLHNPESQLDAVGTGEVYRRIQLAFEELERQVSAGSILYYGAATWGGFRTSAASGGGLALTRLVELARGIAGDGHHFRFIQLPLNMAMTEGAALERETLNGKLVTTLDAASSLGITVIASAAILQGRLSRDMPPETAAHLPGCRTDAQRALQFARCVPGVTTALVGMSRTTHVEENLAVARVPPADLNAWFGRRR